MDRSAIDRVTRAVLAWAPETTGAYPDAVMFLLRRYVASGDPDVRAAAEAALTSGLPSLERERDPWRRIEWLRTMDEAASAAEGDDLAGRVRRALPDAVDAMESAVRQAYEPGDGLLGAGCEAHLLAASALLAAFDMSGRLPYAMLAEELLLVSRRRWWNDTHARFDADAGANAVAGRVLCRLAALRSDPDYAGRVRAAQEQHHRRDAERLLAALAATGVVETDAAAAYGLALLEWFALESILQ